MIVIRCCLRGKAFESPSETTEALSVTMDLEFLAVSRDLESQKIISHGSLSGRLTVGRSSGEPRERGERPERKRGRRVRCNAMFRPHYGLAPGLAT